jgi:hypothetical protein
VACCLQTFKNKTKNAFIQKKVNQIITAVTLEPIFQKYVSFFILLTDILGIMHDLSTTNAKPQLIKGSTWLE